MTKQDIFDIVDKNAASSRSMLKYVMIVGILGLGGGVALLVFDVEFGFWPYILLILGAAMISGSIIRLKNNSYEKEAAKLKDILNNRPEDLVWSYTLAIKGNLATTKQTIMKFRDGTEFEIDPDAIPSGDTNDLVQALTVINPKMHVGYTEELEQMYKEKKM